MSGLTLVGADALKRAAQHGVSLHTMTARNESSILKDIEAFEPNDGNWLGLESLLVDLWAAGVSAKALPVLFRVFERHPEDDGAGVLWSVVHGIESLNIEYEKALRDSFDRKPSFMAGVMLKRLEKVDAS